MHFDYFLLLAYPPLGGESLLMKQSNGNLESNDF